MSCDSCRMHALLIAEYVMRDDGRLGLKVLAFNLRAKLRKSMDGKFVIEGGGVTNLGIFCE